MTTRHQIHLFDGAQRRLGMLPLFAAATFVFAPQLPNAYARPSWSGYQPTQSTTALFAPANPVYNYTGPTVQAWAAHQRPVTWTALPSALSLPQVDAQIPIGAAQLGAAYTRQPSWQSAPVTFVLPQTPDQIVLGSSKLDAAYNRPREARVEWEVLEPWAGAFFPADPVYNYSGPTLQAWAAHLRPTSARNEWDVVGPWAGAFFPPDPAYAYNGAWIQQAAAYTRALTDVRVPAPSVIQTPVAAVPAGTVRADAAYLRNREARAEWELLTAWTGPFYPPDPVYVYAGSGGQLPPAYLRTLTTYQVSASSLLQPGVVVYQPIGSNQYGAAYLREQRGAFVNPPEYPIQSSDQPSAPALPYVYRRETYSAFIAQTYSPISTPAQQLSAPALPYAYRRDTYAAALPQSYALPSTPLTYIGPSPVLRAHDRAPWWQYRFAVPNQNAYQVRGQPGPAPIALLAAYARETRYVRQPYLIYTQAGVSLLGPPLLLVDPKYLATPQSRKFIATPEDRDYVATPAQRKFTARRD